MDEWEMFKLQEMNYELKESSDSNYEEEDDEEDGNEQCIDYGNVNHCRRNYSGNNR